MDHQAMTALAEKLTTVDGVVAAVLGGSRARGTHRPDSDIDIGLYYRGRPDLAGLRALAAELSEGKVEVTEPGGWGPWVDGGGWLVVDGWRVDWIFRDIDRVRGVWDDCREGRFEVAAQAGHPLGFYSHAYAGEVALCKVLADPAGEVTRLREETGVYPPALREALLDGLWEADFLLQAARYGVKGMDAVYTAGCLFRVVGVLCHALHGYEGRWLINEKGMVASAGLLNAAPVDFTERAQTAFGRIGTKRGEMAVTLADVRELVAEVRAKVGRLL